MNMRDIDDEVPVESAALGKLGAVRAVICLGRAFRLSVIAEGANTPAHISRLIDLGCDVLQGYALARPMPAHACPVNASGMAALFSLGRRTAAHAPVQRVAADA